MLLIGLRRGGESGINVRERTQAVQRLAETIPDLRVLRRLFECSLRDAWEADGGMVGSRVTGQKDFWKRAYRRYARRHGLPEVMNIILVDDSGGYRFEATPALHKEEDVWETFFAAGRAAGVPQWEMQASRRRQERRAATEQAALAVRKASGENSVSAVAEQSDPATTSGPAAPQRA